MNQDYFQNIPIMGPLDHKFCTCEFKRIIRTVSRNPIETKKDLRVLYKKFEFYGKKYTDLYSKELKPFDIEFKENYYSDKILIIDQRLPFHSRKAFEHIFGLFKHHRKIQSRINDDWIFYEKRLFYSYINNLI